MAIYTQLLGFGDIGKSSVEESIETNLVAFFDWGFLDKGAYFNVTVPTSGQYGGLKSKLRPVQDPNYTNGQVWEGFRSNWVWESGLSSSTPVPISGVTIGSTFQPASGVGPYKFTVDYPNGRIVFNSPIATNSTVNLAYSYKLINTVNADKIPWFREVQYNSERVDSQFFSQTASGDWFGLGQTRLQLPALAVEMSDGGYSNPYALGGGMWVYRRGVIHVLSEDEQTAKRLANYIQYQNDRTIYMVDYDSVGAANAFPLNAAGSVASGALTYPQMVEAFKGSKMRIFDIQVQKLDRLNQTLFHIPVRVTAEVILPTI